MVMGEDWTLSYSGVPGTAKVDAYIDRTKRAAERVTAEMKDLPLDMSPLLREQIVQSLMYRLMEDPHSAAHCGSCLSAARDLAMLSLGWEDKAAARPATARERMDMLLEQMRIALAFMEELHAGKPTR